MLTLAELTARHARPGRVAWLGVRTLKRGAVEARERVRVTLNGLEGDHRTKPGVRAVSLLQFEHRAVIEALCGADEVTFAMLRRNVVVEGLNLLGLRGRDFRVGTAVLHGTGPCAPCSRMEAALGHGGYAAVRGHGGLLAGVVAEGEVALGDAVTPL